MEEDTRCKETRRREKHSGFGFKRQSKLPPSPEKTAEMELMFEVRVPRSIRGTACKKMVSACVSGSF